MTAFGICVGSDESAVAAYEKWAGVPAAWVSVPTGRASWSDYDNSIRWCIGVMQAAGRPIIVTLPMVPQGVSLADAAKGTFNAAHYQPGLAPV